MIQSSNLPSLTNIKTVVMSSPSIKESVIDTYGQLAKSRKKTILSKFFSCCDPLTAAKAVGNQIGYTTEQLNTVPEEANLGVGCGNPSSLTQILPGQTVVDLGSGAGFDAFIVSRDVGTSGKVIGIDLSEDMIALARKNAKKGEYSNIEFIKGDIEALPLKDGIADHVISNCVINLSQKKDKVYKEAYRILKKGGQMSVSDIVLNKELPNFVKNSLSGHIACVSGAEKMESYMKYIEDAGFQNIQVKSKKEFPLELMLTDPQIINIAKEMNFDLDGDEARDMASRVSSISITASK